MSKKTSTYTREEKRAEKEIDAFLYSINGREEASILDQLRTLVE